MYGLHPFWLLVSLVPEGTLTGFDPCTSYIGTYVSSVFLPRQSFHHITHGERQTNYIKSIHSHRLSVTSPCCPCSTANIAGFRYSHLRATMVTDRQILNPAPTLTCQLSVTSPCVCVLHLGVRGFVRNPDLSKVPICGRAGTVYRRVQTYP